MAFTFKECCGWQCIANVSYHFHHEKSCRNGDDHLVVEFAIAHTFQVLSMVSYTYVPHGNATRVFCPCPLHWVGGPPYSELAPCVFAPLHKYRQHASARSLSPILTCSDNSTAWTVMPPPPHRGATCFSDGRFKFNAECSSIFGSFVLVSLSYYGEVPRPTLWEWDACSKAEWIHAQRRHQVSTLRCCNRHT